MSTTQVDVARYTYRVTWSEPDQEFLATCAEFGSLSWLAQTPEEALAGMRSLVQEVVADIASSGETIPQPFSTRAYSGKFVVRLGRDLHQRVATEAAERRLSMNQYVVQKLTAP